ncbi:hypothetical protein OH77DRAFT_630979 [Trametes cingulata]|nr:hypothetical protein OH77DRAFT_630979 [Trametes cingulata]
MRSRRPCRRFSGRVHLDVSFPCQSTSSCLGRWRMRVCSRSRSASSLPGYQQPHDAPVRLYGVHDKYRAGARRGVGCCRAARETANTRRAGTDTSSAGHSRKHMNLSTISPCNEPVRPIHHDHIQDHMQDHNIRSASLWSLRNPLLRLPITLTLTHLFAPSHPSFAQQSPSPRLPPLAAHRPGRPYCVRTSGQSSSPRQDRQTADELRSPG